MIDPSFPAASWYLWIVGLAFLLGAALPLLFAPLWWAGKFGWEVSSAPPFAVYAGRCLGGVALVLSLATLRAAPAPADHRGALEILLGSAGLLLLVHLWGALRGQQPWQETAEIAMYVLVLAVGLYLFFQLPSPSA
ncbi:MAG: hypothetical protein R6X02_34815 [Enhygromyxa sp.]